MLALRLLFALVGAAIGVLFPFFSAILDSRGFSPEQIGITTALGAVALTVAAPMWGHLGDVVIGRRAALRAGAIGATAVVLWLLADIPPILVVLVFVALPVFSSAIPPLTDALAVNALAGAPRAYVRVRILSSLGFAGASIAAGWVYDRAGFGPAPILWGIAAAGVVVVTLFVPDVARFRLPAEHPGEADRARRGRGGSFGLVLRTSPRMRRLLLGLGCVHIGMLAGFTFLALRLLDLGGQASDVAFSVGISALAEIPAMLVIPVIVARTSLRTVLVAGILLYGSMMASWAFLGDPDLIVATRLVTGVAFAAITIGAVMTVAALLPPELQGTGQGLYQTVASGVAAVIANAIGGLVYGLGGAMPLFLGCAALAAIGAIITWRSVPAAAAPATIAARQEG